MWDLDPKQDKQDLPSIRKVYVYIVVEAYYFLEVKKKEKAV